VNDIVSGLVTATLSVKLLPNTKAFDWPHVVATIPPGDTDHHKLVIAPDSNLYHSVSRYI